VNSFTAHYGGHFAGSRLLDLPWRKIEESNLTPCAHLFFHKGGNNAAKTS
jgi:hypothetical protein